MTLDSQLRVILLILRYKVGTKLFEPEYKMNKLFGEKIVLMYYKYFANYESICILLYNMKSSQYKCKGYTNEK